MCYDGHNIWIGLEGSGSRIVRMDPNDGAYNILSLPSGEDNIGDCVFDGRHVWFVPYRGIPKIDRIVAVGGSP